MSNAKRVGILTLPRTSGAELPETKRLKQEIQMAGHEPVAINYRRLAFVVNEAGRGIYQYDKSGTKLDRVDVDVVIPRIGKYTEVGLTALRAFEIDGVATTGKSSSIRLAKDKIETQLLLDHEGVSMPYGAMLGGRVPDCPTRLLREIQPHQKGCVVVKTAAGSHGQGVIRADSRTSARSLLDAMDEGPLIIQEFIEPTDKDVAHSDIRMIVVGGQIIASMQRSVANTEEEFRANLSLGGNASVYEPTPREQEIAIRSAQILGLDVAGVDMMHSSRGPLVTEVNDNPEFGIETITGVNVAGYIVSLALDKAVRQI